LWKTILAGNAYRGILVNRKKNGELYYVEESICPVRDAEGQITHCISNGRDLSERLRLEAQLLQAQKMDAIGRLAGGVAHDFNNLLTIITSYSELAMDAVPQGSALESKIHQILLAARRAAELTRQLLAFSRKQPQALRVVELNPRHRRHRQNASPPDRGRHRIYISSRRRVGTRKGRCAADRTGPDEFGC
jgi:two-component system, cell cycle sensor histidine kinase and response regulator CckA